jgi:NADH-quinone oxidoreductase subunit L
MTAFYSWRLLFMTFHGQPRADEKVMDHVHESPAIMTGPLVFLATGAVFAGWWGYEMFVGEFRDRFWGEALMVLPQDDTIAAAHHVEHWVKYAPVELGLAGIMLAWLFYIKRRHLPAVTAGTFSSLHRLFFHKWYFDELYNAIGVVPAFFIGKKLWKTGDGAIIDGLGPDGVAAAIDEAATDASKMQTGYVYNYALMMLVGVVIFITAYFIGMGS